MGRIVPRRLMPVFLIVFLIIFATAYYVAPLKNFAPSPTKLVSIVGHKLKTIKPGSNVPLGSISLSTAGKYTPDLNGAPIYKYDTTATAELEKNVVEILGEYFRIQPFTATKKGSGFARCEYPIMIYTTSTKHCTGALLLYASIVWNVLTQSKALKSKTSVHFTDYKLKTIEKIYKWEIQSNLFTKLADCNAFNTMYKYNNIIPVHW